MIQGAHLAQSQNPTQSQDPLSPVAVTAQYLPSTDQLPAITVTAQQGVFASFSTRISSYIGVDLDLNFASYVTPSNGVPYWSHGVSVVLSLFNRLLKKSVHEAQYG
jgi:hypothetical protein